MPRLRDFLTGRDDAIKKYDVPFSRLGEDDKTGLARLCDSLNKEYHQQCRLYKSHIQHGIDMSISSPLEDFTNAVVKYTESLGNSMTISQARTILTSARFLRLCVAGRAVFTERCVESRDVGHVFAENKFGQALVALNNKRAQAIATASMNPKQKNKKKGKKKKGTAKQTSEKKNNNLYEVLINSVDDIEESMGKIELDEQKEGDKEVIPFPLEESPQEEEEIDERRVLDLFLANEVRDMKDTVHDIVQSDHLYSIADSIWGSDMNRNFVHLNAFDNIPLPTRDIYEFIHKFPKNRLILLRLGVHIVASIRYGGVKRESVPEFFHILLNFLMKLNNSQLELMYTCDMSIFSTPNDEAMTRTMRFLKIINNINPLCVAYLANFSDFFRLVFHEVEVDSRQQEIKYFSSVASIFSTAPRVTLREVILEGKNIDSRTYVEQAFEQAVVSGHDTIDYLPKFAMFKDDERSKIQPMSLPVEVLQDDTYVSIKIHDSEVDDYVQSLVVHNEGFCQVFIPSSHIAYFDRERDEVKYQLKYIKTVVHVDGRVEKLKLID